MQTALSSLILLLLLVSPALGQLGSAPDSPPGATPPPATGNITNTTDTNTTIPVTSPPAPALKPALIYHHLRHQDPDSPLTGTPPKNLKKPHITEHIYGGAVEYRKGRDGYGCPCRERVPERHRYDVELRDKPAPAKVCECPKKKKKAKKGKIPPVVAQLYPKRPSTKKGKKKPCKKEKKAKRVHIAPEYKAATPEVKKHDCKKHKKKKQHIQPEFYPPRKHHKHKGKIVSKLPSGSSNSP